MKRKVNRVGQNTLTVSLPNKWAKKHSLKQGDEIDVEEEANSLIISSNQYLSNQKKEIAISINTDNKTIIRSILGALYRKGYDVVKIDYPANSTFKIIQESTNHLIGFEIMENKPGTCIINSIVNETEEEFYKTLNKMLNTIKITQEMVLEDYKSGKYGRLSEIEDYRFITWKLRDLSMRIIIKKNLFSDTNFAYSTIIWTLEKINRNYKRFYEKAQAIDLKSNNEIITYYRNVAEYFSYFTKCINSNDIEKINNIHTQYNKLLLSGEKLLEKTRKDSILVELLIEITQRIQDMNSSLIMMNF